MNRDSFWTLVAERALTSDRPVDVALVDAARDSGALLTPALRGAVDSFHRGDEAAGLRGLAAGRIDALLCEAAGIRPAAARAVRERLDAIPSAPALTLPLRAFAIYLAWVLLLTGGVSSLLSLKVLPALAAIQPRLHDSLLPAVFAAWLLGLASLFMATRPGLRLVAGGVARSLHAARVHATAAGLAVAGNGADAERLLALHSEIGPSPVPALTPSSLDELTRQLARRAERQANRAFVLTKVVGTAVALCVAATVASTVYTSLPLLSQLPEP